MKQCNDVKSKAIKNTTKHEESKVNATTIKLKFNEDVKLISISTFNDIVNQTYLSF